MRCKGKRIFENHKKTSPKCQKYKISWYTSCYLHVLFIVYGCLEVSKYKLGRKFITCDIGLNSIETARDRLKNNGAKFDVLEVKDGVSLYRNPAQTMDNIKRVIKGLRNEDGLDKMWEGSINDSKYGLVPVYIPNLTDATTRILSSSIRFDDWGDEE